jgi:Domain of unknown function (DUF4232)
MPARDPRTTQSRVRRLVRRRRRARVAKVLGIVLAVVVLGGLAAFGIDRGVVYGRRLWAEHHRPAPPSVTTTTTFAIPATTITGPPLCLDSQVRGYLYNWRITSGTLYETVALEAASPTPCTLYGYAALTASADGGVTLPSPNSHVASLGATGAAQPSQVTIATGQAAWFELTYPVTCTTVLAPGPAASVSPGDCFRGSSLGVLVPGGTTPIAVTQPLRFNYGVAGFRVGPFWPGTPPGSPPVG